ncbi:hypothetical protein HDR66_03810 [bacterium]|nr:hypothetical protein [bacterium]
MANKKIDYDATLREFFSEVLKFLADQEKRAKGPAARAKINAAVKTVTKIMKDPAKFADHQVRTQHGMQDDDFVEAFLRGTEQDNGIWHTFSDVVWLIKDLDSRSEFKRGEARQKLLGALKTMKRANNKNVFKDLYISFVSPEHFAIAAQNKQAQK